MTLVCPGCGAAHPQDERFCRACGLPLVVEGGPVEARLSPRAERTRKVKPQFAEGPLVRVAVGRQLPEAEMIQEMLLEQGVPSTLRRTLGFDVPDLLAAGPRDVLVPQSGEEAAREILAPQTTRTIGARRLPKGARLVAALMIGVALFLNFVTLIVVLLS